MSDLMVFGVLLVVAVVGAAIVLKPSAGGTRGGEPYPTGGDGGTGAGLGGSSSSTPWYNTAGRALGGLLEGAGDFGGSGSGGQMGGSGLGGGGTSASQYR
jgi:hypothetical protein